MSCLYPIDAWRSATINESGKRPLTFRRSDGLAHTAMQVPCGKCLGCQADKALSWALRCYHESSQYNQNCFVTLTYDDEHLPPHLLKDDLQKFIKEVRRTHEVRYYACGEYGSKTNRPHYHLLMFGQDFKNGSEIQIDDELYTAPYLSETWNKGMVCVADFTMATACYVAGYVSKKIGRDDDDSFHLMSRRPGIGFDWLRRYYGDILATDSVTCDGQEYPVPKAYIRWAEENLDDILVGVKERRQERMRSMSIDQVIDKRREVRAKEVYLKQKLQNMENKECSTVS